MIAYLLKSILCLGIFLAVYLLFLEKEKMHRFNRWYLLGSILFSFVVPLISFTVTPESLPVLQNNYFIILDEPVNAATAGVSALPVERFSLVHNIFPLAVGVYCIVMLELLTRFARYFYRIVSSALQNKTIAYRGANLVLMKERTASYSFLDYIFINEEEYANNEIEEEIITHELTHVKQKHSWDVIFIELLQAVLWFNPLFIFYKKAIQLNHEYLADEAVIRTYADVPAYQFLLLDKAGCESHGHFTSNFNYSVTKKRLIMMTKNDNQLRSLFKKIAVIPLLACILVFFSVKEITAQEKKQEKVSTEKTKTNDAPVLYPGAAHAPGPGASKEELTEFNAIIDKNIKVGKNGHKLMPTVSVAEQGRLLEIYKQMDNVQRAESRAIFVKKRKPVPPQHPTPEQFEKWKNADNYGVWIGSRKINNEELDKYKAEDFGYFWASNLRYTEAMKQNIMKRYNLKKLYKVQLNLFTNAEAEKMYQSDVAAPPENLLFQFNESKGKKFMVPVGTR